MNPNCIFINRLPDVTKDCDLHEYFSQFGLITDVKVLRNTRDPESLGCAFVTFLETDSVRRVLETQPHLLAENQIIVRVARRKKTEADGTRISVSDKEDDDSLSDEDKSNGDASVLSSDQLTIFVGFLKPEVTESELKAYFSEFGRVSMAQIVHDWITGKSRGFGFVKFADSTAFKRGVLKACHFLNGSRLSVKRSMDRAQSRATCDRPPRELRPERLREEDVNPKGIFVSNLPEVTKDCNLYEYFSKFGLITDVFLLKDTKRLDSRRCGMVFFREADSVKKVFAAQPHLINATQVTIMPARKKNSNDIKPHTKMKMSHGGTSTSTLNTATIFVGRLKPTTTEDDLERYFSKFGTVLDVEVITDRSTGRSRGFAFVTFADEKVFEGGMLEVCHFLHGSRLTVQPSERKSDKVFKSVFNL
ncbi:unnamed protein product [Schistocephalus solidus]|uniref:RRM domain-containing protein n=1 Tax=Schistocephalus solidus TaxID=70667 RepID=A0A3P7CK79_SCHSO|nr:unnamed protein product [Schistocephalus solidus]